MNYLEKATLALFLIALVLIIASFWLGFHGDTANASMIGTYGLLLFIPTLIVGLIAKLVRRSQSK